jgi:glycerol-3-phosphate acyltransferase PlsY
MLTSALLIGGSYLWAAVPTAYLVTRFRKGIDIREFGSGNAGASNVIEHVGRWTGFGLGAFDCLAKGTLPVVLGKLLDESLSVQVTAGLVAIAGHNWSPYLRLTGGRGVATAVGLVLGLAMWQEFLILAVVMGVVGRLIFRETGLWTFIAILALPVLSFLFDRQPEILYMTLTIGLLLTLKRLTANWESPLSDYPLAKVMAFRTIWDRDVPKKAEWTNRRPP